MRARRRAVDARLGSFDHYQLRYDVLFIRRDGPTDRHMYGFRKSLSEVTDGPAAPECRHALRLLDDGDLEGALAAIEALLGRGEADE